MGQGQCGSGCLMRDHPDYPRFYVDHDLCLIVDHKTYFHEIDMNHTNVNAIEGIVEYYRINYPTADIYFDWVVVVACRDCGSDHDRQYESPCHSIRE